MTAPTQFPSGIRVSGDIVYSGDLLPAPPRSALAQENLAIYPINPAFWRIHDSFSQPLTSDSGVDAGLSAASFHWNASSVDSSFFVAVRPYKVVGIIGRVEVAGTDGGAVTAAIKKAASGTDIASGTALHASTINLKGTVDTNQSLTLSTTISDLDIAAGTCIGVDFTGTLTDAQGCVTVALAPTSTDDLRLVGGTFATGVPSIQTGDLKNAGATTRYARVQVQLPPEYVAGETVSIKVNAGMVTTVASASATIDFEVYKSDRGILISGSDLCATAAQSINSTTFADLTFNITATSLSPGDILDIKMAIAVNDSATVTSVIGCAGSVELLLDIKG